MSREKQHTDFEALKNVWKQHYAESKVLKKQQKEVVRNAKITQALKGVEASLSRLGLTFDIHDPQEFSDLSRNVPSTADTVEANSELNSYNVSENQLDSSINHLKAKESLEIIKNEMGLISEEINKSARNGNATKTIGKQ